MLKWNKKRKSINHEMRIICIYMLTNDDHLPVCRHTSTKNQKEREKNNETDPITIDVRPVASMYPLRFGKLSHRKKTRCNWWKMRYQCIYTICEMHLSFYRLLLTNETNRDQQVREGGKNRTHRNMANDSDSAIKIPIDYHLFSTVYTEVKKHCFGQICG